MSPDTLKNRREMFTVGAAGLAGLTTLQSLGAASEPTAEKHAATADKVYRIGVISAQIQGAPQKGNGHTWHFAQYFHPQVDLNAITKNLDPGSAKYFATVLRKPKCNFGVLPFPDTKITHYYEPDPKVAQLFCDAFPGVQVATSLENMVDEVDAIWLGDASGYGEDHFDLIAPGLAKGLPTFCDKPIGGSVAGTRQILEFAQKHKAPLMSSSLFRHQWGMEEALRLRDSGEHGALQYVVASMMGGYSDRGWLVYGQHPAWTVMTLCGPGVEAVSLYAQKDTAHSFVTYADRMPAEIWYGRPDLAGDYCEAFVHFEKKMVSFRPNIEGNFWFGHHYEMFNMARVFLDMVKTGVEPVPHQEILEVTAMIHAGVKSQQEQSRLVALAEVMNK